MPFGMAGVTIFKNLQKPFVFIIILIYTENSKVCIFALDTFMPKVCTITQTFAIVLNILKVYNINSIKMFILKYILKEWLTNGY